MFIADFFTESYRIISPFANRTGLKPAVRAVVSTKANTTPSEPPSVVATEPVLRFLELSEINTIWTQLMIALSLKIRLVGLVLWFFLMYTLCILMYPVVMVSQVSYALLGNRNSACWIRLTPQSPLCFKGAPGWSVLPVLVPPKSRWSHRYCSR